MDRSVSIPMPVKIFSLALTAMVVLFVSGCGQSPSGPSLTIQMHGMTATVTGEFRTSASTVGIKFTDSQGTPVDVGKVSLSLKMNMPGMPMIAGAQVSGSNGSYIAEVQPQMGGTWMATLSYDGPKGSGQADFDVTVR